MNPDSLLALVALAGFIGTLTIVLLAIAAVRTIHARLIVRRERRELDRMLDPDGWAFWEEPPC